MALHPSWIEVAQQTILDRLAAKLAANDERRAWREFKRREMTLAAVRGSSERTYELGETRKVSR